jgi:hypothetical protein
MPALTIPRSGLGATISGTGLITQYVTKISEIQIAVDTLDLTTLANTGYKTQRPSDLRNLPSFEVEFLWTGAAIPTSTAMIPTSEPYTGILATVTFPSAGSIQGTGFVSNVKLPSPQQGQIMKGSYTFSFDGGPGTTIVASNQPSFTVA